MDKKGAKHRQNVYLPEEIYMALKNRAEMRGATINTTINNILWDWYECLGGKSKKHIYSIQEIECNEEASEAAL